jgi:hypothetical protein
MPSEDRSIIFSFKEIYKALCIRCINAGIDMPPGHHVKSVHFDDNDHQKVTIVFENKDQTLSDTVEYTREFFAFALVFYCQGNGIPIPRAGTKSIIAQDQKIILHIHIDAKE